MNEPAGAILATVEDRVGWITISNPARHNAISLAMWQALGEVLRQLEADPDVRVIVLRGAGEAAFASGADISRFEEERSTPEAVRHWDQVVGGSMRRVAEVEKPTLAMIRGFCLGGGLAVASQCDLRFAAAGARFGIPAAKLGVGYDWAGVKQLLDLVGPSAVKDLLFTGRRINAEEALARGLIDRLVPPGDLEALVRETAAQIAQNAPLTVAAAKLVVRELTRPAGDFNQAVCEAAVARCFASADFREGRQAFLEKRKPAFEGR